MIKDDDLILNALSMVCEKCKIEGLFNDQSGFCLKCQTLEGCLIASAINKLKGEKKNER